MGSVCRAVAISQLEKQPQIDEQRASNKDEKGKTALDRYTQDGDDDVQEEEKLPSEPSLVPSKAKSHKYTEDDDEDVQEEEDDVQEEEEVVLEPSPVVPSKAQSHKYTEDDDEDVKEEEEVAA